MKWMQLFEEFDIKDIKLANKLFVLFSESETIKFLERLDLNVINDNGDIYLWRWKIIAGTKVDMPSRIPVEIPVDEGVKRLEFLYLKKKNTVFFPHQRHVPEWIYEQYETINAFSIPHWYIRNDIYKKSLKKFITRFVSNDNFELNQSLKFLTSAWLSFAGIKNNWWRFKKL